MSACRNVVVAGVEMCGQEDLRRMCERWHEIARVAAGMDTIRDFGHMRKDFTYSTN